jgi:hypothetical protein
MNTSDGADDVGGGQKLRRSAAAGDKDDDLHVNWSGTNSIPLGMMTRATRRSSWWSRLGDGRSERRRDGGLPWWCSFVALRERRKRWGRKGKWRRPRWRKSARVFREASGWGLKRRGAGGWMVTSTRSSRLQREGKKMNRS